MASPLKTLGLAAAAYALLCAGAQAAFWRCELPGGVFMVSLPSVSLVSIHEYVVDGAARVTELTVGTNSAVVARFYYLEPMVPQSPAGGIGQTLVDKAQQQARDAAARTGMEAVWQKVVKNYPVTTHAHTVEYRLETLDQLKRVQKSLEDAWRANRETQFKVSDDDASDSNTSGN
ncbi:MAG: hypothetical protein PHQ12_13230 [Chthoniobacteraceae bacterium]|nr:hypothetical protein [Chthoniobacteraceae bacterium]